MFSQLHGQSCSLSCVSVKLLLTYAVCLDTVFRRPGLLCISQLQQEERKLFDR